jgi:YfiH family protein
MYFDNVGNIRIGKFEIFSSGVRAFFTTRFGGVSVAPFDSLNLGILTEDKNENVMENRRRLFAALAIDEEQIARQRQVHGDTVAYVDKAGTYEETDALFTDRPDVYLAVSAADCVPILFFEPDRKIVGVIHAGWRGTEKGIAQKTIEKIKDRFQTEANGICAVIGPSISVKHYEVSEDVAQRFDQKFIVRHGHAKPHLDLWKANAQQLQTAGVRNIAFSGFCTVEHQHLFFSHRASGGQTGRMLGVIGLTP